DHGMRVSRVVEAAVGHEHRDPLAGLGPGIRRKPQRRRAEKEDGDVSTVRPKGFRHGSLPGWLMGPTLEVGSQAGSALTHRASIPGYTLKHFPPTGFHPAALNWVCG